MADAAIRAASTDEERLPLLDSKIEQSTAHVHEYPRSFLVRPRFTKCAKKDCWVCDELTALVEKHT